MNKLLKNEWFKQRKKLSTWLFFAIAIAAVIGLIGLMWVIEQLSVTGTASNQELYEYLVEEQSWALSYLTDEEAVEQTPVISSRIRAYQELSQRDISPMDWRTDPILEAYDWEAQQVLVDIWEQNGEIEAEDAAMLRELYQENEAYCRQQSEGTWQEYLQLTIDQVQLNGYGSSEKEQDIHLQKLNYFLTYGICPRSQFYHNEVEMFYTVADTGDWREDQLDQWESYQVYLLRCVDGNGMLISNRQRQQYNAEIEAAWLAVDTNTLPLSSTSVGTYATTGLSCLSLLTVLMIIVAAGCVSSEFGGGTIKLLAVAPYRRSKIFAAKVVLLLEMTVIGWAAMTAAALLTSLLCGGASSVSAMVVTACFGTPVRWPLMAVLLAQYALCLLPILAMESMALMLSTVIRKTPAALGLSLLLMYMGQALASVLGLLAYGSGSISIFRYLLFTNTSLSTYFQPVNEWILNGLDSHMTLWLSCVVLLVYMVGFVWIARDSFVRRDIETG